MLILFNEKDEYLASLLLIPLGLALCTYSLKYTIRINKSFKNNLIVYLNDDSKLIDLFSYEKTEWHSFAEKYYQKKIKNYKITLFILIPIITIFMIIIYIEEYKLFIILSFIVLLMITFVSLMLIKSIIELKSNLFDFENPKAKITNSGILINNSYVVSYNNQDGWLEKCTYKVFIDMKCLEFKIRRSGGKGHYYQYFNLLIPKEREQRVIITENRINKYAVQKT